MNTWLRTASVTALIGLAACGGDDPTGPGSGDPFDPEQSSEDFGAMEAALAANADLTADLVFVTDVLDTIPAAASWMIESSDSPASGALLEPVRTTRLSVGSASSQPILPADLLGKTFEWDAGEEGYVVTEREGAPANGMRFIVYDRTQDPLVENGFVDVTDESDPSADRLAVHLEKDGTTRLDYEVEVTETTSSASVSVAGYLTDGTERVDFDVVESVLETTEGFRIDLDYSLSLAGQPLSVELDYSVDFGAALTADFVATFVNGANTLVLDMTQDGEGAIDGSVEWNGDLVMTVTDDGSGEPVFLGPEGEELTAAEAAALQEMFEIAAEGLNFLVQYVVFLGGSLG